jgi:hypothetical protein
MGQHEIVDDKGQYVEERIEYSAATPVDGEAQVINEKALLRKM